MRRLLLCLSVGVCLTGCTILREYPRRSEVILRTKATSSVDKPERDMESELTLHGNNRDILKAYIKAVEFTLEQLGLKKK